MTVLLESCRNPAGLAKVWPGGIRNLNIGSLVFDGVFSRAARAFAGGQHGQKMAKAFPGSVVLTQDCPGHTSLAVPSPCTWGHIREYFRSGTLPAADTVCPMIGSPFPDRNLLPHPQAVLSATHTGNCEVSGHPETFLKLKVTPKLLNFWCD
ncbi:hypothetical protein B0H17DRAFT_1202349 [Mycena rosella]|uniref:Peptidase S33 tripeptidyl aminopeptidase-like C-terminal domain-containing protein n=1 Tax=Mycena rosella TaxID=1033263 RepID=A0AAD7GG52_MYCRO|nr:hypothetical protein B0H17DRAFT_1202349 [Mycena rosella]